MSLRRRLTLTATVAVAFAVTLACIAAYVTVRIELRGEVDRQLRLQARAISLFEGRAGAVRRLPDVAARVLPELEPEEGGPVPYVQALDEHGNVRTAAGLRANYRLPVDATDRKVAASGGRVLRDVHDGGAHLRLLTVGSDRGAVQLARPVNSVDQVLQRMGLVLLAIVVGGIGLAALLGRLVTRRVTQPLRDVADAVEHIAETDSLARRLSDEADDEVGRLARRFNAMLDRLEASRTALAASVTSQRQLVADASHELRTPITSLRTNIEVLLDGDELQRDDRQRLLTDVRGQLAELGNLVGDIIELARGDTELAASEDVRLDAVVAEAVARAERHHPEVVFSVQAEPAVLEADAARLGRAVTNLLDNAAKYSRSGQVVTVTVDSEGVTVRDRGPGVPAADLPHLFDRFYRGAAARGVPGTGLGLAIVQQVAEAHRGSVEVANATDGGAEFRLRLPASAPAVA